MKFLSPAKAELTLLEVETSPGVWQNITGAAVTITIRRADGDVGTLSADVVDATLDPAVGTLLRPGKRVRVRAKTGGTWTYVYGGSLDNVDVVYDPRKAGTGKAARVTMEATDCVAILANKPEDRTVGTINHLRWLIGTTVPFRINGSTTTLASGTIVARNDNATLWEQIVLTRDSKLGYAWVDATDRLNVYDNASMVTTPAATIGPDRYSSLDVDFASDRIINSVIVEWMRYDIGTEEAYAIPYGPYTDAASIAEWGERRATFTIAGTTESAAAIETYADGILDRNATPEVRGRSASIPIRSTDDLTFVAGLDLNKRVTVVHHDGVTSKVLRIVGIEHDITGERWVVRLEFDLPNGASTPGTPPKTTTTLVPDGSITEEKLAPGLVGTDGVAPASSPAVDLEPLGLGALRAKWPTVANADPVTYDVYLSTSTIASVPAAALLAGSTGGTSMAFSSLPNGTAFVAGTTYYCRVIARDGDGPAAIGTQDTAVIRPGVEESLFEYYQTQQALELAALQEELDGVLPITETDITNDAITTPKLATNAVIARHVASAAIDTRHLRVGPVNMITDAQFEDPDVRDLREARAASLNGSVSTVEFIQSNFTPHGGYYVRIVRGTTANTQVPLEPGTDAIYAMELTPGERYRIKVRMRRDAATTTGQIRPTMRIQRADGTFGYISLAGTTPVNVSAIPTDPTWPVYIWEWTCPDDVIAGYLSLQWISATSTAGFVAFVQPDMRPMTTADLIVDGGILSRHISTDYAYVGVLEGEQIEAALGDFELLLAGVVETMSSPTAGIKIDGTTNEIRAYSAAGTLTYLLDGDTGRVSQVGDLVTGVAGQTRVRISSTPNAFQLGQDWGMIEFFSNAETWKPGQVWAVHDGVNEAQLRLVGPYLTGTTPVSLALLTNNTGLRRMRFEASTFEIETGGGAGAVADFNIYGTNALSFRNNGQRRITIDWSGATQAIRSRLNDGSRDHLTLGFDDLFLDGAGVNLQIMQTQNLVTTTHGQIAAPGAGSFGLALAFAGGTSPAPSTGDQGTIRVMDLNNNGYKPLWASAHPVSSDASRKENETAVDCGDALVAIEALTVYDYDRTDSPGVHQRGLMAQDVRELIPHAVSGEDGDLGVDPWVVTSTLLAAFQGISSRVAAIEAALTPTTEEAPTRKAPR